jgi:hypothetical protein
MSSFCWIYTCHIVFSYFVVTWTPERTPGQVIYKVYSLHVQFAVLGNGLRAQPTEPGADPGGGESGVRPLKERKSIGVTGLTIAWC